MPGHKYGLVYPGLGWVVWRDRAAIPDDLIFWYEYNPKSQRIYV